MEKPKVLFIPRTRLFVKKNLQSKIVLGVVAAALMSSFLVLVDYYVTFGRNAGWSLDMLGVFMKAQLFPVIQLIVFVVALVAVMLKLSHRVAGPLVNLEQSFRRVGDGDLTTRLQLRPHDELKDGRDGMFPRPRSGNGYRSRQYHNRRRPTLRPQSLRCAHPP